MQSCIPDYLCFHSASESDPQSSSLLCSLMHVQCSWEMSPVNSHCTISQIIQQITEISHINYPLFWLCMLTAVISFDTQWLDVDIYCIRFSQERHNCSWLSSMPGLAAVGATACMVPVYSINKLFTVISLSKKVSKISGFFFHSI